LLDRGIYVAPSQFEAMFLSDAHTEEDIKYTCRILEEYLRQ
jgi:glutamate-1-semialdehyde 2,1-aminomutase